MRPQLIQSLSGIRRCIDCCFKVFYGRRQSYGVLGPRFGSPPGERDPGIVSNLCRRSINKVSRVVFFFFFPCKQTQRLSLSPHSHTHTHTTEESHYRKCGFINNNSISFNEHCRYIIENKSETGETSSQES